MGVSRVPTHVAVDTADAQERRQFLGVGPAVARLSIECRAAHGPFRSLDALRPLPKWRGKTRKAEPFVPFDVPAAGPAER